MTDVGSRLRDVELDLVELRTEFNNLQGMLKLAIVLILAHFGYDVSAVL